MVSERAEPTLPGRVARTIRDRAIFTPGERVVVAVSGGPDSTALLAILRDLQPTMPLHVTVAHFDHAWRAGSGADRAAVEALANRWGYQCIAARADPGSPQTEAAARRVRYAFLRRVANQTNSSAIATGHTQDDQVETLLLHLLRGAGSHGLAAMRPRTADLARPLLSTSRADLAAYLAHHDLPTRHDPSNDDPRFARNRLRQLVLPALDAFHPQARRLLARAADILAEEDHLLDDLAGQARQSSPNPTDTHAFAALPVAIQRRLLRRLIPDLDFEQEEAMRGVILAGRPPASEPPSPPSETPATQTLRVHACHCDPATFRARDQVGHVDPARIVPPLRITPRAPGDRVRPLGFPHDKKLQDILVDAHVPRHLRDTLPIVRDATGIVWIPGVTVAESKRVNPSSTEQWHLEIVTS
jgi:tRNA(Ile)-lysidine synthase